MNTLTTGGNHTNYFAFSLLTNHRSVCSAVHNHEVGCGNRRWAPTTLNGAIERIGVRSGRSRLSVRSDNVTEFGSREVILTICGDGVTKLGSRD